jgi:enoyl-CoA hydratase/carnithine racemase
MTDQDVLFETSDGIARVTLNRPAARNAMTLAMYDRLQSIFADATVSSDLRAIVVTGAGGRAFASGTEISTFRDMHEPADALAYEARIDHVLDTIERCPIPTVAVLAGACTGGGAAIAACCDIRIGTADLRIGFPIARTLGNCLSVASISRLVALVGAGRVRQMLLTADLLTAEAALTAGLVTEILPDHISALDRGHALARQMASNAPLTIRASKEALRRLRVEGAGAHDDDLVTACYMSEDFRNAVNAFIARQPPVWKGR